MDAEGKWGDVNGVLIKEWDLDFGFSSVGKVFEILRF